MILSDSGVFSRNVVWPEEDVQFRDLGSPFFLHKCLKRASEVLRTAKIAFLEPRENDPRTRFYIDSFFHHLFDDFAECILTEEKRTSAPPRTPLNRFWNFETVLGGGPGRPKGRNGRPQAPPEIAHRGHWGHRGGRRALRERPWGPKCHFGGMRSYLGNTYIGPAAPPK